MVKGLEVEFPGRRQGFTVKHELFFTAGTLFIGVVVAVSFYISGGEVMAEEVAE